MLARSAEYSNDIIGPVMAAQILMLDRSTVRRLVNNGTIPVHAWTPGGHARFLRAEIETLRSALATRTKQSRSVKRLRQRGVSLSRSKQGVHEARD